MTEDPRTRVADLFDRLAPDYDQGGVPWFRPIASRLVELLHPAPGERVIDIGAGRGAVTFPLCHAVGATGHVTAVDISRTMTELLRVDAADRAITNLDIRHGDVADLGLDEAPFDVAVASLVLFFCADPAASVRSWLSLVRPRTGRIGITTFGPQDDVWQRVDGVFTPFLPSQLLDARTSGSRGPFAHTESLVALFEKCGAVRVSSHDEPLEVTLHDAAAWKAWSMTLGQRAMWAAVPHSEQGRVFEQAAAILEDARRGDGLIHLTQHVRYTTATAP